MLLENVNVGLGITGSFCTFEKIIECIKSLKEEGANIIPIMTKTAYETDTRFGKAKDFISKIEELTNHKIITTITEAEPIGPNNLVDVFVIAPCTGNTLSKLANAITDNAVMMTAKSHLRNNKPVVISISTNDALGINAKNLGFLLNSKNIFFVPFGQDDCIKKPKSLISDNSYLVKTIQNAKEGIQLQPLLI